MSYLSAMDVALPEGALLVKLFYECKGNAAAALLKFRLIIKNLLKRPLLPQALKSMITRFENTRNLTVQPV